MNIFKFMDWLLYTKPIVSVNSEASVLGTLSEPALTFAMTPILTNLPKELTKDTQALQKFSMDKTSASSKMRYGLAETFSNEAIRNSKDTYFLTVCSYHVMDAF